MELRLWAYPPGVPVGVAFGGGPLACLLDGRPFGGGPVYELQILFYLFVCSTGYLLHVEEYNSNHSLQLLSPYLSMPVLLNVFVQLDQACLQNKGDQLEQCSRGVSIRDTTIVPNNKYK